MANFNVQGFVDFLTDRRAYNGIKIVCLVDGVEIDRLVPCLEQNGFKVVEKIDGDVREFIDHKLANSDENTAYIVDFGAVEDSERRESVESLAWCASRNRQCEKNIIVFARCSYWTIREFAHHHPELNKTNWTTLECWDGFRISEVYGVRVARAEERVQTEESLEKENAEESSNPRVAAWAALPDDVQRLASIASIFSQKIDAQIADATATNADVICATVEKLVDDMADLFVYELKRSGWFAERLDDAEGLEDEDEDVEDEEEDDD